MKSCISEKFYQQLPTTTMQKLKHISVKSATGSNLTHLGVIHCSFNLGNIKFHTNLIICRNLTHPLILGRDFVLQHHITIQYADNRKCVLAYRQQELVASIDIEDKPQIHMAHSVTIPGRTLAIVCVYNNLRPHQSGSLYEIEPNDMILDKYPNIYIIHMMHSVDVHRTEYLPLVIINLSPDDISLSKGEIMGFMQIQSLEISEIMTETSTKPSAVICEDKVNEVLIDQKETIERKFITSPADIEVHRKIELQDDEISDDH